MGSRRAFWKAVAADAQLRSQFTPIHLHLMKKAMRLMHEQMIEMEVALKYEIHHLDEVAKGGAVYDVDNLVVMTPKRHIDFHGQGN